MKNIYIYTHTIKKTRSRAYGYTLKSLDARKGPLDNHFGLFTSLLVRRTKRHWHFSSISYIMRPDSGLTQKLLYVYMSISIRISIDSKYKLFWCYDVLYMRSICFHGRDSICLALNLYVYAISNESFHPLARERKRERERAHKMSIISYIPCNMYKYTSPFCANQILLQQQNSRVTIIPIYANEEYCIVHITIWCDQFQQRNLSFSVDDVYRIFFCVCYFCFGSSIRPVSKILECIAFRKT